MASSEAREPAGTESVAPASSGGAASEPAPPVTDPPPGATLGAISEAAAGAAAGAMVDRQTALRALRSLEATEARLERNARREAEETRGKLVQELLPVLDNLDRTIRAAHAGRSDPALLEGVRLVRQQLEGVLRGYGVERIDALGQRFDPAIHEAIGMIAVDDPQRHGAVVHEAEPGYRMAGRLLRPAKVSVGKLVAPPQPRAVPYWR
ncbi:MAG TPA: nucleotide exchange factor GrpE [Kofleriaceae bacterium]|jgi:molecular chaperone GrpE (heat shock protein)|nr:nucleotide exchange factor GrpE [Kofleriaceae bacterium]